MKYCQSVIQRSAARKDLRLEIFCLLNLEMEYYNSVILRSAATKDLRPVVFGFADTF